MHTLQKVSVPVCTKFAMIDHATHNTSHMVLFDMVFYFTVSHFNSDL